MRQTGSSVYQVFDGAGTVRVGEQTWTVARGDLIVVPSWTFFSARADPQKYEWTDWVWGPTALYPQDEPPMFTAIPLDSVSAAT